MLKWYESEEGFHLLRKYLRNKKQEETNTNLMWRMPPMKNLTISMNETTPQRCPPRAKMVHVQALREIL